MVEKKEQFDETSCGLVVFREENGERLFLLLHYPSGHWDFPKGHIEKFDQNEKATAKRELEEETGISDITFIEGYREIISYKYRKEGRPSNKAVIFFLGKTTTSEVKISFEHHSFIWMPFEKALKKLTFDNARNILKKAGIFLREKFL